MRKFVILFFAVIPTIITYNHFHHKNEEIIANQDKTSESYRIEEENNLIIEETIVEEITEEELTTYISDINDEVDIIVTQEEVTPTVELTLKNTFITLTDFIFYKGEIKGKTFNELTTSTKESIISLYEKIDSKIEEKFPGYKETIKETSTSTYNNIKAKLTTLKNDLSTSYKQEIGEDNYIEQEELFDDSLNIMKDSFEPVINTIVEKSKEIYEDTKEKADSWYQEWKEDVVE